MSFSHHIRTRLIRRVALGLAAAAILVPSAQASLDPGGLPCTPSCASFESTVNGYGELHQFPGAGLVSARAYGELHQFPNAGVGSARPDDRAIRPVIIGGPGVLPAYPVDAPRSGPATNLPAFSIDSPRTAPDTVVAPNQPVRVGVRGAPGGLVAPAQVDSDGGADLAWPESGIGIAIGMGALLALAGVVALGMSRRRGNLQGA